MTTAATLARMGNHPNRGRQRGPTGNPTPQEVTAARERAGITQTEAAAKIRGQLRSWQGYEDSGPGNRRMHPGLFELFLIKTGQPLPDWMKGPSED